MSRSRAYSFTINNHTFEDLLALLDLSFKYLCFSFEHEDEGTPHIQGYIYFWNARRKSKVFYLIKRWHVEISKGTPEQNRAYCSKESKLYEFGEIPHQGLAQWEKIEDAMKDPKSNPHLFNQYRKTYRYVQSMTTEDDKDRLLYTVNDDNMVALFNELDLKPGDIAWSLKSYDMVEKAIVLDGDLDNDMVRMIKLWQSGYPQKRRIGYENILIDPDYIILICSAKYQYDLLTKKFENIENWKLRCE